MDLLLILTYVALCTAIFKIFKIPLNKWTVPTAFLGGVFLIGALIFTMNYNHPYSEISRQYFTTSGITPVVKGHVIEVPVLSNTKVKKGDVLFKIDPTPYTFQVKAKKASLQAAMVDLERAKELMKRNIGKQRELDQATALVVQLQAEMNLAEYNLDKTVVRAPTDGFVTQQFLRPGIMVVPMPFKPAMVFVHEESFYYVGWFHQNSTLRLKEGFEAEVAFDAVPGEVFSGIVDSVLPVLAQGEVQAKGNLLSSDLEQFPGRVPVIIKITDPDFEIYRTKIPGGSFGQSAIYSDQFQHLAVMRKILLRMSSWINYLFPFH